MSDAKGGSKGWGGARLSTRPQPIKRAIAWVRSTHRRQPKLTGALWAIAVGSDHFGGAGWKQVGVAVVGRPVARLLDNGLRLEVVRVAVEEGVPNGCSMLYGACARAARAMGASDILTYTHADEEGTSVLAAGWVRECDPQGVPIEFGGGQWGRVGRPRETRDEDGKRHRWWAPWSERIKKNAAAAP